MGVKTRSTRGLGVGVGVWANEVAGRSKAQSAVNATVVSTRDLERCLVMERDPFRVGLRGKRGLTSSLVGCELRAGRSRCPFRQYGPGRQSTTGAHGSNVHRAVRM